MGRVSRVLKAAGRSQPKSTQLRPIGSSAFDDDLPRLAACWPYMSEHHRLTIMSLVEMTEADRRRRSEAIPTEKPSLGDP